MSKDINVFDEIGNMLMSPPPLFANRLPTFYPSSASCINEKDKNEVLGGCVRAQYYRCAGFGKTNPSGLFSQYIFKAGNMWEDVMTEWLKEAGLWIGNTIKFQDLERYISGEIDIMIKIPETEEKVIIENKTYSSSNYQAKKAICGSRDNNPEPKDQNLLQSFLYLDQFKDQEISKVYLTYFDRACGGPENHKQFIIEAKEKKGKTIPVVTTDFKGKNITYEDERISIEGIYARYEDLMNHLKEGKIPKPDFKHEFTSKEVEDKHKIGLIAKTRYENFQRNPEKYPIGDWQCSYCDYKDLCKVHQEEGQ
jgi:hypothetical protein